jgi:hypothetical protein
MSRVTRHPSYKRWATVFAVGFTISPFNRSAAIDSIRAFGATARICLIWLLLAPTLNACTRAEGLGVRSGSPADDLPQWISPLLSDCLRPDWSADGTHLVYLDALVGNVHELELETSESRTLTAHYCIPSAAFGHLDALN